jgi:pimeloyl-ACP methyl ester carboxylesterase
MQEELGPGYLADTQFKENISKLIFDMAISLGILAFVRQSRTMQRRQDQQALLRKIKCPTLILCGAKDPFYLPKRHEFIAELIETAHLKVIEDAAHFPTLEQPKETNDALRAWLSVS